MIHETDLPCTDCGTGLVERAVDARELPIETTTAASVAVAQCPDCGARYYPDGTLSKRFADADATDVREGTNG